MSQINDPFSASFDAIDIDSLRAPSPSTIADALASLAPKPAPDIGAPGFFLIDDAGGRFEIDREMGVVSLRDEAALERERFAVHAVRVRVVESSGESYEMELKLRLTGRVPQMVGAEDALFSMPAEETPRLGAPFAEAHWTKYAAANAAIGKAELARARRDFIQPELPITAFAHVAFTLGVLPPVGLSDDWSL